MNKGFRIGVTAAGLTLLVGAGAIQPAAAQDRISMRTSALPASISDLRLAEPLSIQADRSSIDPALQDAEGRQQVLVRLRSPSVAKSKGKSPAAQQQHKAKLKNEQSAFFKRANKTAPGAKALTSVQMVLNAVVMEVDADSIDDLAADKDVFRISRVRDYEMDLSETVPYIGAAAVQADGFDGSGISVAVLDSGIDYYHANLGGSGDPAEYAADDPTIVEPGTFPTAKVVGGWDFTGSEWPVGPVLPDPDPLDDGPQAGHGSHVADIIGGAGGVAPGVDLYAVKVCSSVSTSCSGIALINGMEFVVDPNGDGNTKDHMDVVNMSLGSPYGQPFDDDLSAAVDAATAVGVLTVTSAGNSADKPYVTGSPGAAATALSTAQTNVPSAVLPLMEVTAPGSIAGLYQAVFQPWSTPLTSAIEAPVVYGDGAGGNLNGCAPFAPATFAGEIVLVDRGACNFTLKIKNIGLAGGSIGIIGLVAPGDPFGGGDGGDRPIDIPGYMISQADSNALKSGLPATVARFDPAVGIPLIMAMVGSSSRGPQNESTTLIKPEIGAPGASVSAIAGTGTGTGPFGGTSGASPMVAGSAALLLDGFDTNGKGMGNGKAKGLALSPLETKAILMNNGETNILNDVVIGSLAPITRIGGGEVRIDNAISAPIAAWEAGGASGGLSFGFVDVADANVSLTKTVQIHNYSNKRRNYSVTPTFRFADDVINGAVSPVAPASITVNPGFGNDELFDVTLNIDGTALRDNFMNSGSMGANPSGLTTNEYDGYLILDDGDHPVHLPWHVLPRKAARVVPSTSTLAGGGFPEVVGLHNTGVGTAQNDAYALIATSPNQPEGGLGEQAPMPDIRAVGVNTFPVPAGFCSGQPSFLWAFAINTWERQEHLIPVSHQVILDTNQDGVDDYVVLNRDQTFSGVSDGRQLTWALNLATGDASAFFFTEHSMNTGNTVLYICGEQVGLSGSDLLATNVDVDVFAQDWYYGGPGDLVEGLTITPLGEQFFGLPNDVLGFTNDSAGLSVFDFGPFPGNSPELGLLLITNGDRGAGARGGATQDTEALLLTTP
jgi:subtilisin family serine protease